MVISGKPFFNWQPYVPITFELGVLLAALSTVVGMFAFNQLPMHFHPLFSVARLRAGHRRRLLHLGRGLGSQVRRHRDRALLRQIGATDVELVPRGAASSPSTAPARSAAS